MEDLSAGSVVLARFPFSDLTNQKLRPCLIIGQAEFEDIILCQITSKPYGSKRAISLWKTDFQSGTIAIRSYIRPDKIATLDQNLIVKTLGTLGEKKFKEVKNSLTSLFSN